jgi:deoxyribodipyrimidine photolyase-related protein
MQAYVEQVLWPRDISVEYMSLDEIEFTAQPLVRAQKMGAELVYMFDPTDHAIEQRYKKALETEITSPFELRVEPSPSFMLRRSEITEYFGDKTKHNFTSFYQWQRERFNILIDEKYKPVGGKWSYDVENRKSLPKEHVLPGFASSGGSKYVQEATTWVSKRFPDNPGSIARFYCAPARKFWPIRRCA